MTRLDAAAWAFAALNVLRTLGYVPQIAAIWRCPNGAGAISLSAWGLWTAAHLSTAAYAFEATGDRLVIAIMLVNAGFCGAVVALTAWKRRRHKAGLGPA